MVVLVSVSDTSYIFRLCCLTSDTYSDIAVRLYVFYGSSLSAYVSKKHTTVTPKDKQQTYQCYTVQDSKCLLHTVQTIVTHLHACVSYSCCVSSHHKARNLSLELPGYTSSAILVYQYTLSKLSFIVIIFSRRSQFVIHFSHIECLFIAF